MALHVAIMQNSGLNVILTWPTCALTNFNKAKRTPTPGAGDRNEERK